MPMLNQLLKIIEGINIDEMEARGTFLSILSHTELPQFVEDYFIQEVQLATIYQYTKEAVPQVFRDTFSSEYR